MHIAGVKSYSILNRLKSDEAGFKNDIKKLSDALLQWIDEHCLIAQPSEIKKIRQFFVEHQHDRLPLLNKKIDFTNHFFELLMQGAPISELKNKADLIKIHQYHNYDCIFRILNLIMGNAENYSRELLIKDIKVLTQGYSHAIDDYIAQIKKLYLSPLIDCASPVLKPKQFENMMTLYRPIEVEECACSASPSWLREWIVKKSGTKEQLQNMHANWFLSMLKGLPDITKDFSAHEKILCSLCEYSPDESSEARRLKLINLVGEKNIKAISDALLQSLKLISTTLFVEPVDLFHQIDEMPVLCEKIDYMISIINGGIFETLMHVEPIKDQTLIDLRNKLIARLVDQRN
jgi:hypothetical protein